MVSKIKSVISTFWQLINRVYQEDKGKSYWLTRFVLMRFLGIVYLFAFLSLVFQVVPLIGERGLLPANNYLDKVEEDVGSQKEGFLRLPSIFWIHLSDYWLVVLALLGVVLSLVVILGYANFFLMLVLWFLYMSFVNIGQLWYSYGWEIQLLETGFLAMFLVPWFELRPFPKKAPPVLIIWLFRWLAFRIYLGAGLIKIRGDTCWRKLTCMYYYYETQPIPNPMSRFFHFLPSIVHKFGTLWNYFVELVAPFFIFLGRRFRIIAGVLFISFQIFLISSGNLSFLNWVTIVPGIALFDDNFLKRFLPKRLVKKAEEAKEKTVKTKNVKMIVVLVVFLIILYLSVPVIQNLISSRQIMNTSFDRLHLVNTYGAFGTIGKVRPELVVQGTKDIEINEKTKWKEYGFLAKPTDVNRNSPFIAPYQPRIDWQIWFAAMSIPEREPWLIHFVWKLLNDDKKTLKLIKENPFPDKPPRYIRIEYYIYRFADLDSDSIWEREYVGSWLPPLSKDNEQLKKFIEVNGWEGYSS